MEIIIRRKNMKHAKYWGIPCLFNEENNEIVGKNWLFDKLIYFCVWFDMEFRDGFYIKVYDEQS